MNLSKLRKIFKENELRHYQVFPREHKIVLTFDNDHTLSIETIGHSGINYKRDKSIVVKMDEDLIAKILS